MSSRQITRETADEIMASMEPFVSPMLEQVWGEGSIQDRFEAFHRLNPWVYEHLVRLARQLRQRGHERLGIGMLWEVLRWQVFMGTFDPSSEFKLNDHYRSRYARLIMDQETDLRGAFEIRELKA